ncbi:MAG: hypothetical protein LBN39_07530 [Planctomycetaceae bacterium]|jgi:hypothetical protein|nr:hypothetical protein [Planctomycetaceae bacterium]
MKKTVKQSPELIRICQENEERDSAELYVRFIVPYLQKQGLPLEEAQERGMKLARDMAKNDAARYAGEQVPA